MTPEINEYFADLKSKHGNYALQRIESMLSGTGRRHPLQSDAKFVIPGLSREAWLDIDDFEGLKPLVSRLEKQAKGVKKEIQSVYTNKPQWVGEYQHYLGKQHDWNAVYLFQNGRPNTEIHAYLPETWDIFINEMRDWHCPLLEVHFSILQPGAVIKPHCDLWNFSLNLHLAVDIPERCELTVAHETRQWQEGKCLLFDYSYLHEAKNLSDKPRVCLLMDVWHPDLSMPERDALTFLVTEIRKYI